MLQLAALLSSSLVTLLLSELIQSCLNLFANHDGIPIIKYQPKLKKFKQSLDYY